MKPMLVTFGIFGLLFAIAAGAFMAMGAGGAVDYSSMTGAEVYGKLCSSCHGSRGTAPNGSGNSYVGKRGYWDEESLLAYIANPPAVKKKMPHLARSKRAMNPIPRSVPTAARERLVAHVIQLMDTLQQ
jgi:mono/diheme cytochrome c family protein